MEMNKDYIIFNLREALKELERAVEELQGDSEYGEGKFMVAMEHAYHHMNTAWNARNCTEQAVRQCTLKDSERWRQFPTDMDLSR
jgi:hypothetical protein